MFAVPEFTVLPPVQRQPSSPTALVRWVAAEPQRWRDLLSAAATAPAALPRWLPHDDPRVQLWLALWPPGGLRGATRPWRRYDAPQGAFAVLSGAVVEYAAGAARTLRPGQVRVFGPGYRHSVRNAGADPALTVHVQVGRQSS